MAVKNPTVLNRTARPLSLTISMDCDVPRHNGRRIRSLMVKDGMNIRKPSKALDHHDVREIQHLWHHCARIGLPLNMLVSAKPHNADTMNLEDLCKLFDRIKNLYGQFARRRRFTITYIWVRETLPDNSKDHLHLLCHVPKCLRARFMALAVDWLPLPREMDVRPATQAVHWLKSGKCKSASGYLCKNMTPQAAYKRPYLRKKGGMVMGQRWGCSHILKAELAVL